LTRLRRATPVALALVALLAAVAYGAVRERRLVDAKKDAHSGVLDIAGVRFGVGEDGRLRAIVTMAGAWADGELLAAGGGPPGSVCVRLYTKADPEAEAPDYLACATAEPAAADTAQVEAPPSGTTTTPAATTTTTTPTTTTTTGTTPTATTDVPPPATLRGQLLTQAGGGLPKPVKGTVAVSRPTKRSITLRFSQSAIGRPATVRFVVEATRAGCPRISCTDRAPAAPRAALLRLHAAR
jgi:hypothetical protein